MSAEGTAGGLLVVGSYPTKDENLSGVPFSSFLGRWVRNEVAEVWDGPVVYDNALRCKHAGKAEEEHIGLCRGYLAQTFKEGNFDRVVCVGPDAVRSVLGRYVDPLSARGGYAYTENGTPVFILMPARIAQPNKHLRVQFKRDLQWACHVVPEPRPVDAQLHILETLEDAESAAEKLRGGFAFDVEWMGLVWDDRFVILSVSCTPYDSDESYVWNGRGDLALFEPLRRVMEDAAIGKSGWNIKGDVSGLKCGFGIEVRGVEGDGMIWRKQLSSEVLVNLETAQELVGMGGGKDVIDNALGKARKAIGSARKNAWHPSLPGFTEDWIAMAIRRPDAEADAFAYGGINPDLLMTYNALDSVSTKRLVQGMRSTVLEKYEHTKHTWNAILQPSIRGLTRIEERGMMFDLDTFGMFEQFLSVEIDSLEKEMFKYGDFDPSSPDQLRVFLFEKLALPMQHMTKHGGTTPSTDADALKKLTKKHPVVPLIAEWKVLATMRSKSLRQFVRPDGRVHTRYTLGVVRSLRLSSTDPNMQNQPSRNKRLAKMLKDCFIVPPGRVLISLDYSQIEYRVAAILSKDPAFRQVFIDGHDLHRRTAEMIAPHVWGIKPENVGPEHRYLAKNVNFGVLFGMTVKSLAKFIGVSVAVAQRMHTQVMAEFPGLRKWISAQISKARRTGEVWSEWQGVRAHRRDLYEIGSPFDGERSTAEHVAINHPIQSGAAFYTLVSVNEIDDWLVGDGVPAMIVNTIHDDIMIEADESVAQEVIVTATEIMESHPADGVPLVVKAEVGKAWGSLIAADEYFQNRARQVTA